MSRGTERRFLVAVLVVGALVLAAGAIATPAAASAPSEDVEPSAYDLDQQTTVSVDDLDGERYWVGQQLEIDGFDDGETVTFEHEERFRQRTADEHGAVVVSTDGWFVGEWTADGEDSNVTGTFILSEQELETVAFESEHAVEDATLHVESNRAVFDVALSSDDLETDELAAIVDEDEVVGEYVVLNDIDAGKAAIDVDVSDLQGGQYDLEVDVIDSTAGDSAHLEVSAGLEFEGYHPLPYEGSDRYWDVTGDRSVTTLDLQAFFQHQHRHDVFEEHPEKFDFSDNGEVGQPDVVALFHALGDVPTGDDPDAEFVGGPYSIAPGSDGRIEVDVTDTDDAWVELELDDYDYAATIELENLEDADDTVTIDVDAYQMGHEAEDTFSGEHVAGFEERGDLLEPIQEFDNHFTEGFTFLLASYAAPPDEQRATDRSRLRITSASMAGEDLEFVGGPYEIDETETAAVELSVSGTDDAFVEVGIEDRDYTAIVELEDIEEPDDVTVEIDPEEIGHDADAAFVGEHVAAVEASGAFRQELQEGGHEAFEAVGFQLAVHTSDPELGSPADETELVVGSVGDAEVTTSVAPAELDGVEDAEALRANATERDAVAHGDLVVATVGLTESDALDDPAALEDENYTVTIRSITEDVFSIDVDEYDVTDPDVAEVVTVLSAPDGDGLVLAFDSSDFALSSQDLEVAVEAQERSSLVTLTADSRIVVEDPEVAFTRVYDPEADETVFHAEFNDDDRLLVPNGAESRIAVETNLAPGFDGDVFVETRDATYSTDVVVEDDGLATATFDFSSEAPEPGEIIAAVEVNLRGGADASIATEGLFVAADGPPYTIDVDVPETAHVGESFTLDAVVENEGYQTGYQTTYLRFGNSGDGWGSLTLEPGQTFELSADREPSEPGTIEWEVETGTHVENGTVEVVES